MIHAACGGICKCTCHLAIVNTYFRFFPVHWFLPSHSCSISIYMHNLLTLLAFSIMIFLVHLVDSTVLSHTRL